MRIRLGTGRRCGVPLAALCISSSSNFLRTTSAFLVASPRSFASSSSLLHRNQKIIGPCTTTQQRSMASSSLSAAAAADSANVLRVALCQFKVTASQEENHATCRSFLKRAAEAGAQLAVLPEIWASPYATAAFPDYAEDLSGIVVVNGKDNSSSKEEKDTSPSAQVLRKAAKEHNLWIVGGSIAEKEGDKFYNTCLVLNPAGQVVAKHRKVHLFDIDVPGGITFFESDTLHPGSSVSYFDLPAPWNVRVGVGICYDIRFAGYAMLLRQKFGCKILVYPGAFNLTTGPAHWELLQRARALDNQCHVLACSPARTLESEVPSSSKYPHYTAWGHSTATSPWGEVLATTDEKEGLVMVDLDLDQVDSVRQSIPIYDQQRSDLYQVVDAEQKQI